MNTNQEGRREGGKEGGIVGFQSADCSLAKGFCNFYLTLSSSPFFILTLLPPLPGSLFSFHFSLLTSLDH